MKQTTYSKSLTLGLTDEEKTIDVIVNGEWDNNGIGAFECHGYKGFDRGQDYFVVTGTEWDTSQFNDNDNRVITMAIEAKISDWENEITESLLEGMVYPQGEPEY